jgi:hypothetical protein
VTFSSDALPGLSAYPALQLLFSEISVSSVSRLLQIPERKRSLANVAKPMHASISFGNLP